MEVANLDSVLVGYVVSWGRRVTMVLKPHKITLDDVVEEENLRAAIRKMRRQRSRGWGEVSPSDIKDNPDIWVERLRKELLDEIYEPEPAKYIEIAKDETDPSRGTRPLAITSVRDHVVQTAIALLLVASTEEVFLDMSYGFRPKRNQHLAIGAVQAAIGGPPARLWALDLDFRSYFDTVNHDILMRMLDEFVEDRRLLRLIRKFLTVGHRAAGRRSVIRRDVGVPQGGALSPVLANIYLHPLDLMLAESGHPAARYADDLITLLLSRGSALRVHERVTKFAEGVLRLTVHPEKTRVRRVNGLSFLGFEFALDEGGQLVTRPNRKAIRRLQAKLDDDIMNWCQYYEGSITSWGDAADLIAPDHLRKPSNRLSDVV